MIKRNEIIRSEKHPLRASEDAHADMARMVSEYRKLVRALAGIIYVNLKELREAPSKCSAVERLFHKTKFNLHPRYGVLDKMFHKFPSYLRRAAIEAAFGAVSSFVSNYARWASGIRRNRTDKPPSFAKALEVNPPLYGGNCIVVAEDWCSAKIKVLRADGTWGWTESLKVQGKLIRLGRAGMTEDLSPTLIVSGRKAHLACPVKITRQRWLGGDIVCAVDLGINTAATCAIVDSVGTVGARQSFKSGGHNDQLDRAATHIRQAAEKTLGPVRKNMATGKRERQGKLSKGFCRSLYNRIKGLNNAAASSIAHRIIAFALQHGATTVVFERLKGWRPKGPRKSMRLRFHRWLHQLLIRKVTLKCEEAAIKVALVNPRGTSSWAYDGSGEVTRDKKNYSLCTFASGKRYNADYSAALNIAARFIAQMLGVTTEDRPAADTGRSSGSASRMPIVLADIWAHACASDV